MFVLPTLRSLARAVRGKRPRQQDLDRIIDDLRRRLQRGQPASRHAFPRLSPGLALRQLRALQLRKLRRTVAYAGQHVPYYQRTLAATGLGPRTIRTWDDLRRLPITRRADLQAGGPEFISRAPGLTAAVELHTSGTTGQSLDAYLTRGEFEYYASVQAISGMLAGFLSPADIAQVHLPLDASIAAQVFTAAAQRCGALVLNLGLAGTLDAHLESLLKTRAIPGKYPKVSSLFAAPGYLWALTARAEQRGIQPSQCGLRRIFSSGALVSDALKQRVHATWGLRLMQGYSLVEAPSTGAFECDHGRLHFLDLSGIIEFLDPQTERPVAPGQPGVAVVTAFYPDRELMPVLRYWTDDLMRPSVDPLCPCGLVTTSIEEILGRADQMVTVGGQNYYPQPVGDALTVFHELVQPPRFLVRTEERAEAQCTVVEVECAAPLSEPDAARLVGKIVEAIPLSRAVHVQAGMVKCEVRLVPAGSIPNAFRYKLQGPSPG